VSTDRRIRVLALSPIPEEGAGCRFRIAQFIPYLESVGISVTLDSLFTPEFFRLVYKPGHYAQKAATFIALSLKRLNALRGSSQFDLILVYREMFPLGPAVIERLLAARHRPPIVFDFDDAIFLPSVSDANRLIAALKQPQKVASIIRHSDHVIAGNEFLASYARRYNQAVTTIPTCVDTERFVPSNRHESDAPSDDAAGQWSAGSGVRRRSAFEGLRTCCAGSGAPSHVMRISGAGESLSIPGVSVDNRTWSLGTKSRSSIPATSACIPWQTMMVEGKCGFKAIEFMACGVGNGICRRRQSRCTGRCEWVSCRRDDEWVDKLSRLLSDASLRRRFAAAGRRTVEEGYSLHVNAPALAATLRAVAGVRGARDGRDSRCGASPMKDVAAAAFIQRSRLPAMTSEPAFFVPQSCSSTTDARSAPARRSGISLM
jgi:glycosyltransferase involved in cell wall biosynthesis